MPTSILTIRARLVNVPEYKFKDSFDFIHQAGPIVKSDDLSNHEDVGVTLELVTGAERK